MLWISWDNNQIFKAKNMLKLFSLIKRFFRVGPEERPGKVRGGGKTFFWSAYARKIIRPPLENWSDPRLVSVEFL